MRQAARPSWSMLLRRSPEPSLVQRSPSNRTAGGWRRQAARYSRVFLQSAETDRDASRRVGADNRLLALLAELRMAEHHFVLARRHRQVPQRRFAIGIAVNPDGGPRRGVDVQCAIGH